MGRRLRVAPHGPPSSFETFVVASATTNPQDEGGVRKRSAVVAEFTHMDSRDFDALEARARDKLPPGAFAFAAGGAGDEITLADNIAAWQRLRLRPRMLRDVTAIDTAVNVLGERIAAPLIA